MTPEQERIRQTETSPVAAPQTEREAAPETSADQEIVRVTVERERPTPPSVPHHPSQQREPAAHTVSPPADPFVASIENILAEGLTDVFNAMDPQQQETFKKRGEATAVEIAGLLTKVKVQVKKVLGALRAWLRVIPQVNEFFLEKETKIKMDRLMALHEERMRGRVQ